MLPRDAFFGPTEDVPGRRGGRARSRPSRSPPTRRGSRPSCPASGSTRPVIDYLRSGLEAGMVLPDPADKSLETIRVVREAD